MHYHHHHHNHRHHPKKASCDRFCRNVCDQFSSGCEQCYKDCMACREDKNEDKGNNYHDNGCITCKPIEVEYCNKYKKTNKGDCDCHKDSKDKGDYCSHCGKPKKETNKDWHHCGHSHHDKYGGSCDCW